MLQERLRQVEKAAQQAHRLRTALVDAAAVIQRSDAGETLKIRTAWKVTITASSFAAHHCGPSQPVVAICNKNGLPVYAHVSCLTIHEVL